MIHLVEDGQFVLTQFPKFLHGTLWNDYVSAIHRELTVTVPNYQFMTKAHTSNWDGTLKLYKRNKFPIGFLNRVTEVLSRKGLEYKVITDDDDIFIPNATPSVEGVDLFDDQLDAIYSVIENKRAVVKSATGSGKTEILCGLISVIQPDRKILILVNKLDLMRQMAERIFLRLPKEDIGLFYGKQRDWNSRILVSTVQSMNAKDAFTKGRIASILRNVDAVFSDECFPTGTSVDGKPIESIRIGDSISSWNENTGSIEIKNVTNIFKSNVKSLVRITLSGGRKITCTPGHPFFSSGQWVPAVLLYKGSMVLSTTQEVENGNIKLCSVQEGISVQTQQPQSSKILFSGLQEDNEGFTQEFNRRKVSTVWDICESTNREGIRQSEKREVLLLSGTYGTLSEKVQFGEDDQDKPETPKCYLRENEEVKSYEEFSCSGESELKTQTFGLEASCTRREWKTCPSSPITSSFNFGLGCGVCCQNQNEEREWLYNKLQDRCSKQRTNDWDRNRWFKSLFCGKKKAGCEERKFLKETRVENIEILEQGSDGEFEQLCPGGIVYNLEVEDNHTYFAEGILVHNCHHSPSKTWTGLLERIPASIRVGVSATPDVDQFSSMMLEGWVGPVVYDMGTAELSKKGRVILPEAMFIRYDNDEFCRSQYHEAYQFGIAQNEIRNKLIIDHVKKICDKGNSVLVFAWHLETQCKELLAFAKTVGLKATIVHGRVNDTDRVRIKNALNNKDLQVVIADSVWDEGVDVPTLNVVVNAGGLRSFRKVVQMVGRSVRLADGKDRALYIDIFDDCDHDDWDIDRGHHLKKHAASRLASCVKEGYNLSESTRQLVSECS